MESLDVWNPNLSQDQKDKILRDNFQKLNTALQFLGFEVLQSIKNSSVQSLGTTYAPIASMQSTFISNGGLILFIGNFYLVNNVTLQLLIDGQQQGLINKAQASAEVDMNVPILWSGVMPAGSHTVTINGKESVTGAFGSTSVISGYDIIEFRKG